MFGAKFRLTPWFAFNKRDYKLEEAHRELLNILKDDKIDSQAKMSFYNSLLLRLRRFREEYSQVKPEPVQLKQEAPRADPVEASDDVKDETMVEDDEKREDEGATSEGHETPMEEEQQISVQSTSKPPIRPVKKNPATLPPVRKASPNRLRSGRDYTDPKLYGNAALGVRKAWN